MLQATVHPVRAHHKEKKPPGASVDHNSAFEYWNHELDSTYTTTAFDEFPSHLTTKSSDSTGLPQLSGEQYAQFSSRGLSKLPYTQALSSSLWRPAVRSIHAIPEPGSYPQEI